MVMSGLKREALSILLPVLKELFGHEAILTVYIERGKKEQVNFHRTDVSTTKKLSDFSPPTPRDL